MKRLNTIALLFGFSNNFCLSETSNFWCIFVFPSLFISWMSFSFHHHRCQMKKFSKAFAAIISKCIAGQNVARNTIHFLIIFQIQSFMIAISELRYRKRNFAFEFSSSFFQFMCVHIFSLFPLFSFFIAWTFSAASPTHLDIHNFRKPLACVFFYVGDRRFSYFSCLFVSILQFYSILKNWKTNKVFFLFCFSFYFLALLIEFLILIYFFTIHADEIWAAPQRHQVYRHHRGRAPLNHNQIDVHRAVQRHWTNENRSNFRRSKKKNLKFLENSNLDYAKFLWDETKPDVSNDSGDHLISPKKKGRMQLSCT